MQQAMTMREFCDECIRLSELIINFAEDEMNMIVEMENDAIKDVYTGRSGSSLTDVKRRFLAMKIQTVNHAMQTNIGLFEVRKTLAKLIKEHPEELKYLGLKYAPSLRAADILINCEKLKEIVKTMELHSTAKKIR